MPMDIDGLRKCKPEQIRSMYTRACQRDDVAARELAALILESGLLADEKGGLPYDHPIMIEIAEICSDPAAIDEAVSASEQGLPALAGPEYRIAAALGSQYGPNYTTNYAGVCVRDGMVGRGWSSTVQKPMPESSVAKTATVFVRKDR
jgi:hypothetical protein